MHRMEWLVTESAIAIGIFLCLAGASLGSLAIYGRLPARHRDEETAAVVRLVANIFVVVSSLMLSLMLNSAKNTYSDIDRNLHAYATDLILFDRQLRAYGPETAGARQEIRSYLARTVSGLDEQNPPLLANRTSEQILHAVEADIDALQPVGDRQQRMADAAAAQLREIIRLRWTLVEQSEGTIPAPLLILLVAWLMLILASFGYRAPRNATVVASFIIASALLAGAIFLILDMDVPFRGPIQVSDEPLRRAFAEMQQP